MDTHPGILRDSTSVRPIDSFQAIAQSLPLSCVAPEPKAACVSSGNFLFPASSALQSGLRDDTGTLAIKTRWVRLLRHQLHVCSDGFAPTAALCARQDRVVLVLFRHP